MQLIKDLKQEILEMSLQEKAVAIFASVFVLCLFVGMILSLIRFFNVVTINSVQNQAFDNLKSSSEAHLVLLNSYQSCRNQFISRTREECLIQMKNIAEIENLDTHFDKVYTDLKQKVWSID